MCNKGPIPESMTTMTQLEGLYLFDNFLSGYKIFSFPIHTYILTYILSSCANIPINLFTGKIPIGLSDLPYLSGIYLFTNNFTSNKLFFMLLWWKIWHICICMYVYMYVYMYICMYVFIFYLFIVILIIL